MRISDTQVKEALARNRLIWPEGDATRLEVDAMGQDLLELREAIVEFSIGFHEPSWVDWDANVQLAMLRALATAPPAGRSNG